jgi:hypothetical protein
MPARRTKAKRNTKKQNRRQWQAHNLDNDSVDNTLKTELASAKKRRHTRNRICPPEQYFYDDRCMTRDELLRQYKKVNTSKPKSHPILGVEQAARTLKKNQLQKLQKGMDTLPEEYDGEHYYDAHKFNGYSIAANWDEYNAPPTSRWGKAKRATKNFYKKHKSAIHMGAGLVGAGVIGGVAAKHYMRNSSDTIPPPLGFADNDVLKNALKRRRDDLGEGEDEENQEKNQEEWESPTDDE